MAKFLARLFQGQHKDKTDPTLVRPKAALGVDTLIHGRYHLEAEIGRGGLGIVYRARDLTIDRNVAVKVINLDTANALTRQQFLQEAEIHSSLHHANIVGVYETGMIDAGAQELSPYIVMEWLQGISLERMSGLTYARILDIGKQICDALEYIHQQGFVYRDLKPGNVLIEKRGFQYFVKLIDFGLARPRGMAYLPNESSLAGSFFYLAPELINGKPADIASDLYALGATLYGMVTDRVPFSNFDEQTILSQHLEEPVIPPSHSRPDILPALEAIILRLLEKDPKDRYDSAGEVREALEQVRVTNNGEVVLGNLPRLSTQLIERENDLVEIKQLLESGPLVTLVGRAETLALAIGAQLADQFSDGVWWVDFESVHDPSRVLETLASVLGIRQDPRRPLTVSLIEFLREKNIFLILVHCDRVLSACVPLVETILNTCSDVQILITSHQPLSVSSEKSYRVTS